MAANPLVYKWLSALLCYPEADMLDALPEFQTALARVVFVSDLWGRMNG